MHLRNIKLYCVLVTIVFIYGCTAAAVVTGGTTGISMVVDERTVGTFIEDQFIELKALNAMCEDKALSEQTHINITSYNTVVLLTGEAPSEELRQRAANIALNIEKVTHVHNEISIAAPSSLITRSSDLIITGKVKTKMLADKNVVGLKVKIVTENGIVYLMGLLSQGQANIATDIARSTGGAQKVVKLFEYVN